MIKRWSWIAVGALIVTGALVSVAQAKSAPKSAKPVAATTPAETDSEAGLDLTLRSKAAAMPLKTADGSPLESMASHVYLVDFATGAVLADKAGDQKMYPSSMTKMMTLYLVFERLKQGALTLNNQFTVSEKAWRMQGSKMFVPLGAQVPLEDLIRGIAIQSGNDACIVVAEGIAGSEEAFAAQMNETAKKLGMNNTHFTDASGWPNAEHVTTAQDLEILARAMIREFPQYYHYLSEREFVFHGIRQFNRNLLLGNASMKVDGLKTGHTEAAGYGITLSAVDPASARRLVLVINGLDSDTARAQEGERLLQWGFTHFVNLVAFKAGQTVAEAAVWMGEEEKLALTVASDVVATLPKTSMQGVKAQVEYALPLIAPVVAGQEVGKLTLTFADGKTHSVPLVAAATTAKLPFLGQAARALGF